MPLYREFELGGASVAVWKITERCEELLSMVSPGDAAEARLLCGEQRRKEWLAVRLLLARVCGDAARIVYDSAGKPFLYESCGYISISHTRGYALFAYSEKTPFGIDVELVGRDAMAVSRRFVNDSFLPLLCGEDASARALAYWCSCEALFKLVGNVGGTYKDNIFIKPFQLSSKGEILLSVKGVAAEHEHDYRAEYDDDGVLFTLLVNEVPLW